MAGKVPTPHIGAQYGEVADKVIMAGDPLRAKFMAENFLENPVQYNNVRGMLGYTGTYKGKRVSATACTPFISGFSDSSKGSRYANVFPEPVGERRIKSFPSFQVSMDASCMGFNDSIFKLLSACIMDAESFIF